MKAFVLHLLVVWLCLSAAIGAGGGVTQYLVEKQAVTRGTPTLLIFFDEAVDTGQIHQDCGGAGIVVLRAVKVVALGDIDEDHDLDMVDFAFFQSCFGVHVLNHDNPCWKADWNQDSVISPEDWYVMEAVGGCIEWSQYEN